MTFDDRVRCAVTQILLNYIPGLLRDAIRQAVADWQEPTDTPAFRKAVVGSYLARVRNMEDA